VGLEPASLRREGDWAREPAVATRGPLVALAQKGAEVEPQNVHAKRSPKADDARARCERAGYCHAPMGSAEQSRCGCGSRAVIGIAVILLQLALPILHSFLHSVLDSLEIVSPVAVGATAVAAGTSAPDHDAASCPVCTALAHAFAATSQPPRVAVSFDATRAAVAAGDRTLPISGVASPVARAPPLPPARPVS